MLQVPGPQFPVSGGISSRESCVSVHPVSQSCHYCLLQLSLLGEAEGSSGAVGDCHSQSCHLGAALRRMELSPAPPHVNPHWYYVCSCGSSVQSCNKVQCSDLWFSLN